MTANAADTSSTIKRLGWIDATRGLSVVAVVLFHVVLWQYTPETASEHPPLYKFWQFQNSLMGSLRIPLLLVLSGFLAHGKISRGFRSPGIFLSSVSNYYIYLVWLLIYAFFFAVTSGALPHRIVGLASLGRQLVIPDTTLWFVFALAVYVPLLCLVRRIPPWIVLSVLIGVAVVMGGSEHWAGLWPKIPSNAIFFAIGVYATPWLRNVSSLLRWWHVAPAAAAPCLLLLASGSINIPVLTDLVDLAVKLAFVALAIISMTLICHFPLALKIGTAIGKNTLPIYVLHAPLIYGWLILADGPPHAVMSIVLHAPVLAAFYPLILTLMMVAGSLLIHFYAVKFRLGFLFLMPALWRRMIERRFASAPLS